MDVTTDEGRYVTNVIIGTHCSDNAEIPFLITSEVLDKAKNQTICKLYDNSLFLFWQMGYAETMMFFITDAAPYMIKAAKSLDIFSIQMIYLTCFAHRLHRISEEIHKHFLKVDNFISNKKTIFLKALSRVLL